MGLELRGLRDFARARRAERVGRLEIDEPISGAELKTVDGVRATGWAWLPDGVDTVHVTLHGARIAAKAGLARMDVAKVVADGTSNTGWMAWIPQKHLREGENELEVVASGSSVTSRRKQTFSWSKLDLETEQYDQVDLSGERLDPRYDAVNGIVVAHHARYRLASSIAAGKRVLDAGCGYGYGSQALLNAGASSVDSIDLASVVIKRAAADYPRGIRFTTGDLRELPYRDSSFDLIVCFEVIEHMVEQEQVLDEFRRVLAPDGLLIISTPNAEVYPQGNPWHLRELTTAEFEHLLAGRFQNTVTLTQQLHLASVLGDRSVQTSRDSEESIHADVIKLAGGVPGDEEFVVVLASDAAIPEVRPVVAVGDARDELVDAAIQSWMERAITAEAEATMLRQRMALMQRYGSGYATDLDRPAARLNSRHYRREMQDELDRGGFWMYDWDLGDLGTVEIDPGLRHLHETRLELIEGPVRRVLEAVGPEATVLDLACCEGWFAHQMLSWGAGRVVGVDIRGDSIRRARRIRDHLGIDRDRLQFHESDIFALPDLEPFDVVLCLGLVYHLENPVGALRVARSLTKTLCAVESQLTEQREPILAGNGYGQELMERPESFAAWMEQDQDTNPLASHGEVLSLIPNEAALLRMASVAGFSGPRVVEPEPHHAEVYRQRRRAVMVASARAARVVIPQLGADT